MSIQAVTKMKTKMAAMQQQSLLQWDTPLTLDNKHCGCVARKCTLNTKDQGKTIAIRSLCSTCKDSM
eukprot:2390616-Amphidinium_carterae.1